MVLFYLSPVFMPAALAFSVAGARDHPPPIEFFEAIAQLIPVLLLVVAFEARAFHGLRGQAKRYVFPTLATVAWIVVGEVAALAALAGEAGTARFGLAVAGAAMAGTLALIVALIPEDA